MDALAYDCISYCALPLNHVKIWTYIQAIQSYPYSFEAEKLENEDIIWFWVTLYKTKL